MFWVQVGWKVYKVFEDPKDPMNLKFKKFANLKWMKEKFNVHAYELMDFQMMSEEPGVGMVAYKQKGILRVVAFKYDKKDKQMTNYWHQDFAHDFINVRGPGAEADGSLHASNAENHNYQLVVRSSSAKIFYLSTAANGNGALTQVEMFGKVEGGQLTEIKFKSEVFPISAKMKAFFRGHGVPEKHASSPKRFSIHKHFIALAWPQFNKIALLDTNEYEVRHMIGASQNKDLGKDESEIGARVLKIGGFHNDQGDNIKVIYSSRDTTDPNGLSFHEVHFFSGQKDPFHHKHLVKSKKGGAEKSIEEQPIHFLEQGTHMVAGGDHQAKVHLHAHFNARYVPEKTNARRQLEDPAPTTTAAADPAAALQTWNEGVLARHNALRAKHGDTPAMELDQDLIKAAQAWSESQLAKAQMEHATSDGTFGENLAYSMSSSQDFRTDFDTTATQRWYDEIKDFDFSKPAWNEKTGHFTQVVWKASTKLGCGTASDGPNVYVTCRYSPAGNMMGAFPDNVLPLTDGSAAPAPSEPAQPAAPALQSGSGSSSGTQEHDSQEEEFNSNNGGNTAITKHTPAATKECPKGSGSANVFKNKFQSEECVSCNQILAEANGKEYDIYVAHQLCPNIEMQSSFTLILVVFVLLVIAGVAAGSALGVKHAPQAPDYASQNQDTQKATTTNQMNDSVKPDPKQLDEENGDIELKKKDGATQEQEPPDTARAVETDRPMVQDQTQDGA